MKGERSHPKMRKKFEIQIRSTRSGLEHIRVRKLVQLRKILDTFSTIPERVLQELQR
jgi:hypothetical protein